jgi:hypothetical protein
MGQTNRMGVRYRIGSVLFNRRYTVTKHSQKIHIRSDSPSIISTVVIHLID